MIYYAKSKEKELSIKEKERLCQVIQKFLDNYMEAFEDHEIKIFQKAQQRIWETTLQPQKTLIEHSDEIVACAQAFFECYGDSFTEKEKVLILEACRFHDIGKSNLLFQVRVNSELRMQDGFQGLDKHPQIPHGYLSAISISQKEFLEQYPEMSKLDFEVLVTAIYYHHTRAEAPDNSKSEEYNEKYYLKFLQDFTGDSEKKLFKMNKSRRLFLNESGAVSKPIKTSVWHQYVLVKGMLNKFDWIVSGGYTQSEFVSDVLEKRLKRSIEDNIGNKLLPAQAYMREHKNKNLVIIAPTGSGKTEAALLWIDGEMGFYTLPLRVSSNAIYERIKTQYDYSDVSLLHSDSMSTYLQEESSESKGIGLEKYEKAKLLSAPLTICTVDQLFKFVYKALGTEIFAATLKYSKLVLDEIQAYSPDITAALIFGLKMIHQMGGHFAIITATFPPVLMHFMERCGLIEGNDYQMRDFSEDSAPRLQERHKVSIRKGDFDYAEMIEQAKTKKVLVICNTVSKAQQAFEELRNHTENSYLLHSRFIRQHRKQLEQRIMEFSREEGATGIWVTTQIVEASLDIDFDMLYTEMCPADSLLQRMGRCNRAGRYIPKYSNIQVFLTGNGIGDKSIYEEALYSRSVDFLREYEGVAFLETMKSNYINRVYATEEIRNTNYYKKVERYLELFEALTPMDYTKEEADRKFRDIKSITIIPESVYEANSELILGCIELLQKPHIDKAIKAITRTKLENLTLSISVYGRIPEGINRECIVGTAIYRARLQYDFSQTSNCGCGMFLNKLEDESCFF